MSRSNLFHISYYNTSQEIRLSAYADTIVFEQVNGENIIRAIRIGGYPEVVHALSDAIYAGGRFDVEIVDDTYSFKSECKRYERQLTHDGVYKMAAAERFLGGGTDFKPSLREAISLMENAGFERADVVFITDGECILPDEFINELREKQTELGFSVTGILLDAGCGMDFSLKEFCEKVYRTSELMGDEIVRDIVVSRL